MKGKKTINVGDLVQKVSGPNKNMLAIVVAEGSIGANQTLAKWRRIQYITTAGYEWVQKDGMKLVTKGLATPL